MEVQVETTSATQRKISITVPASEVDAAFERAYRAVSRAARLPGFRPGKIPKGLLDVHYGPQLREEVEKDLVGSTLFRAIRDANIAPVTMPSIRPGELSAGQSYVYSAEIEIQPNIEIKQYKHLVVPPVEPKVEDAAIDAELEELRKQAVQVVPVMIRDVVEQGDIVLVDYEGSIGGVAFEGGKGENALIEIGGEGFLPEFSTGLAGAKVPSERTLAVTFPADYPVAHLAGKGASFRVRVKELKRKEMPKLDDDFAKDVGEESLAALREKIRVGLSARAEREARQTRRRTLFKALVAANPFELPPSLVRAQADRMIAGAADRIRAITGREVRLSEAELTNLRENTQADAEEQVRAGLLLLEAAKKEGLEVAPGEIDAEITAMIEQAGEQAERVRAFYAAPENRERMRYQMLEDKAVRFLLEHAAATPEEAAKRPAETPKKKAKSSAKTARKKKAKGAKE
ncbi:MAG: trigger factor [Deltaproteobacteria bacterium]|nr:trigger factor [Deltaproteobacteria bacterium]